MASYQDVLNRAQGVAATPYTPYTGELVAGVNPQQTTGISGINDYAYSAQPTIQQAEGMATAAASPITAAQIAQYQSPYTAAVVNATQNQFNNANQQQMQGVRGTAIAQGALGGNREAVAEAETANQQQLAQAPVIAGLMNQGYTTGLNTALTEQQALASGANQLGNLGVAGQGAGLSGAGAQVGAGSLEQGTQQALDAALLQQFQTAQAFPYQQTNWLAGIDSGVGSQMGGTGTTTAPAPSMLSQLGGLGTAGLGLLGGTGAFGASGYLNPASAAFMFSDRRVKENIKKIGKLFDGQTIYRYNYKGDPTTRIGLIAQNVERHHPDAVREIGGIKAVNYDDATKDAIRRWRGGGVANFDTGGGVTEGVAGSPYGLSGMPFAGAHGYIPAGGNIAHGRGNMPSAPNVGQPQDTAAQLGQQIGSMAKAISGGMQRQGVNPVVPGAGNVTGLNYGPNGAPISTPTFGVDGPVGEASGGRVGYASGGIANLPRGYAEGGSPDWGVIDPEAFSPDVVGNPGFATADLGVVPTKDGPLPVVDSPAIVPAAGGDDTHFSVPRGRAVPAYEADRWAAEHPATFAPGVQKVNPDGTFTGPAPFGYGPGTAVRDVPSYDGVVAQREAPVRAAADGVAGGDDALPAASQPASGVVPTTVASNGVDWSGSGKLWPALAAAGFGMMASKSPFPGVAVGEGGISGMQTYAAERQQENQQALKKSELDLEVKKLAQQADIAQKHLELSTKPYSEMTVKDKAQLEESKRQHDAQIAHQEAVAAEARRIHEVPVGYRRTDDGALEVVPGGPAAEAKRQHDAELERKQLEESIKLRTPVKAYETRNGTPVMAMPVINPDTKKVDLHLIRPDGSVDQNPWKPGSEAQTGARPAVAAATGAPAAPIEQRAQALPGSPGARNDGFIKQLETEDPAYATQVKNIADYKINPNSTYALKGNRRERIMSDVQQYDPTYDGATFAARNKAVMSFATGKHGDTVKSFDVAISHLDTLEGLSKALENKDVPLYNRVANTFKEQFGKAAPTNFEAARDIVGDEIVKAVMGSGTAGALGDREEIKKNINKSGSPAQLAGVIKTYKELMAGQVRGIKKQYEDTTFLHNFDDRLSPETRRELLTNEAAHGAPTAATVRQNGHTYQRQSDGSYKAID